MKVSGQVTCNGWVLANRISVGFQQDVTSRVPAVRNIPVFLRVSIGGQGCGSSQRVRDFTVIKIAVGCFSKD